MPCFGAKKKNLHRRLMHSMVISSQLLTQLHRKYTSEGKKNSIAVTSIAPAPAPDQK
jgi:hypothetical protein